MPADVPVTITISRPALVIRIRSALAKRGRQMRCCRRVPQTDKKYFVIDVQRQAVVMTYTDLVQLGRDLGCLERWERLAER
jgi:hypothetical protein